MNTGRSISVLALLFLVACSSGGGDTVTPTNSPPKVTFTFAKLGVPRANPVDLTITATDADGDQLTINWTVTRGTLTAQNAAQTTMRWATPATVGVDTVRIQVTDGTSNRALTEVIQVGTALSVPPSLLEKSKSPYIVNPSTADPTLKMLSGDYVIEAGVELLIDTPETIISVLGRLEAHGTDTDRIVFRPNLRNFGCGDARGFWEGIRASSDVANNGDVDLEYVELWGAQAGVRLLDNSTALVRNSQIRCSGNSGLQIEGYGSLRVFDTSIDNGRGDGIAIAAIVSLPDSVRIQGCTIEVNGGAGIRMDLDDAAQEVPIFVEYNDIEFNFTHGISLAHAVFPRIHYNYFSGNGDTSVSNLFLQSGFPTVAFPLLDATCNFWGSATSSQAAIDASIWDSVDAGSVHTRVTSCPWLNANPLTTPPPPVCNMTCP